MSYWNDECPDPWKARREGEEAGHRGWGLSNPYSERARENRDQPYCEEAEQAWRSGMFAGEERRRDEEYRETQHQAYLAYLAHERELELEAEYEAALAAQEEA